MDIAALDPTRTAPATGSGLARAQGSTRTPEKASSGRNEGSGQGSDSVELSQEAQAKVTELKARDQAVKAHEAAHLSAAGGLAQGGASFTYEQGPDGRRYAIGGEVSIDSSVPKDPAEALTKARQIRAAALAPADPSPTDRQVAAQAIQMEARASAELAKQQQAQGSQGAGAAYRAADSKQATPGLDVVA